MARKLDLTHAVEWQTSVLFQTEPLTSEAAQSCTYLPLFSIGHRSLNDHGHLIEAEYRFFVHGPAGGTS